MVLKLLALVRKAHQTTQNTDKERKPRHVDRHKARENCGASGVKFVGFHSTFYGTSPLYNQVLVMEIRNLNVKVQY